MGIICGLSVQVVALVIVNLRADWNKDVRECHLFNFNPWLGLNLKESSKKLALYKEALIN